MTLFVTNIFFCAKLGTNCEII